MSEKPVALVAGASSGLGYEFAKLLAADGYDLVLVARSREKLAALAHALEEKHKVTATPLVCDLSQVQAAEEIAQVLEADNRPLRVVINNAGFGLWGNYWEQPIEQLQSLLQVNVVALAMLTRRLLPLMLPHKKGRIMNVASTAAFQPGPLLAAYFASKAFVLHLSEAIDDELRGTGITVTAFCPGPTETGFSDAAQMAESRLFKSNRVMAADVVARIGYRDMQAGKRLSIPGFTNKFLAWATRLPPRNWLPRIARAMQEKA